MNPSPYMRAVLIALAVLVVLAFGSLLNAVQP